LGAYPKQAELTSKRQTKKRLTFDLLLLRLEGLARGLGRLLQAKDRSFLLLNDLAQILVGNAELVQLPVEPRDFFIPLLEGCLRPLECDALPLKEAFGRLLQSKDRNFLLLNDLAQILVGNAELVQLPVEPRDFFIPLLEGCLRPLECDALPLKEALGLFSCQALALEGGPSLSKCGPLLLELSLRLLARISLLPKLLLRRGEGGGFVVRVALSSSAFLAFSSAWLCQARAPWSCWSWARVVATSVSHSAATVCAPAKLLTV
jgi:hypothetical protein